MRQKRQNGGLGGMPSLPNTQHNPPQTHMYTSEGEAHTARQPSPPVCVLKRGFANLILLVAPSLKRKGLALLSTTEYEGVRGCRKEPPR